VTARCRRCDRLFQSTHAAAQHGWKSTDDDHDDLETLDEALEEMFGADGTVTDGADGTVTDGADGTVTDGADGTVTDGDDGDDTGLGLGGPPSTEIEAEPPSGDNDPACPNCGHSPEDVSREMIDADAQLRCTECDARFTGGEAL